MSRSSRRQGKPKSRKPDRPQVVPPQDQEAPSSTGRRLLLLLVVGVALVAVAVAVRMRVSSNPLLRIPPIETADLLPAVAKEIEQKQAAIVARPDAPEAWGDYGLVLLAHGFRREAGDCFAEAERLDDADYRWPYYLGVTMGIWDTEISLAALERAVEKEPSRLSVRMRLAEWMFDLRRLDDCERQVTVALAHHPDSPRVQLLHARLLFQRGDIQEALAWAKRVAGSPKGNRHDAHDLLAQIYQMLGKREEAAAEVERAEKLPQGVEVWDDPEMGYGATFLRDASVLHALADISRSRGDMDRCLQTLRQAIASEPDNVRGKEKLAAALVDANRYDDAAQFLDRTIAEHADSPKLALLRGRVYVAQGDPNRARQQFERAIKLKPDYDDALMQLGQALMALRDYPPAIQALGEAVRLSPTSVEACDLLGQALVTEKKYPEAVEAFRQACQLTPENVTLRQRLVAALLAAGQPAEAAEQLREAARFEKDPTRAEELLKRAEREAERR